VSAVIGRRAEAPQDEPEVPEIPEWLVDELHGNVAFVRDAIEANPTAIAVVYARDGLRGVRRRPTARSKTRGSLHRARMAPRELRRRGDQPRVEEGGGKCRMTCKEPCTTTDPAWSFSHEPGPWTVHHEYGTVSPMLYPLTDCHGERQPLACCCTGDDECKTTAQRVNPSQAAGAAPWIAGAGVVHAPAPGTGPAAAGEWSRRFQVHAAIERRRSHEHQNTSPPRSWGPRPCRACCWPTPPTRSRLRAG
jgi:hypothetical protein